MCIIVSFHGKNLLTPEKRSLAVPTQALAEAIAAEFPSPAAKRPLTSLAYTAIDRVAGQEAAFARALLAYLDTDTLCYRATELAALAGRQQQQWDPILAWAQLRFDAAWTAAGGIMPAEQSPAAHQAAGAYLEALSPMRLAAACSLASGYSSLLLALAVLEKHVSAGEAFALSRLEEDFQAEQWGRDEEAQARARRIEEEILAAGRFLDLLERP